MHIYTHTAIVEENYKYILSHVLLFQHPIIKVVERETELGFSYLILVWFCSHFITCELCRGEVKTSSRYKTNSLLCVEVLNFRCFLISHMAHIHLEMHLECIPRTALELKGWWNHSEPVPWGNTQLSQVPFRGEEVALSDTECTAHFSFTWVLGFNAQKRSTVCVRIGKVDPWS